MKELKKAFLCRKAFWGSQMESIVDIRRGLRSWCFIQDPRFAWQRFAIPYSVHDQTVTGFKVWHLEGGIDPDHLQHLLIILLLSLLPSPTSTAVQVLYDEPTGRLALVFELMVTISGFLREYRLNQGPSAIDIIEMLRIWTSMRRSKGVDTIYLSKRFEASGNHVLNCHNRKRVSMSWSLHPTSNGTTLPMELGCARSKISTASNSTSSFWWINLNLMFIWAVFWRNTSWN